MICQENITTKSAWCAHINLFGDCYKQTNQTLCEDDNIRDCKWVSGSEWDNMGNYYFNPDDSYRLTKYEKKKDDTTQEITGICVPKYAPGYTKETSSSSTMCGIASATCSVKLVKGLLRTDWWCDEKDPTIIALVI